MSKEIAQTVGGKKIAYLIAILAAFAALAYLATNGKVSEAAEVRDQAPLVLDISFDATIPDGGRVLTDGATAEVQIAGDILTDALAIRLNIQEPVPQNGQTTQTADMESPVGTGTITATVDYPASRGISIDDFLDTDSVLNFASWENRFNGVDTGVRSSSAMSSTDSTQNVANAPMYVEKEGASSAAWLYTAFLLGGIAFGAGVVAVAKRSK